MKNSNHLSVLSLLLLTIFGGNQNASAHPMMPLSFWQNLRNCASVYVVPSEFNLTNNSTENYEFEVYLVGGGGGGGVSTAGTRGKVTQGRFVLEPTQNMYAVVGGGGGAGCFYGAGSGGAGYYGGGAGGAESNMAFGGGGGGGSSALLRNGVVLFHANGGTGGGSASSSLAGGAGGTNVGGGVGGLVAAAYQGISGGYRLGGQAYCSNGSYGVELINGGRGAEGGKTNYEGGSFGQRGLSSGTFLTGCSGASGGGGFGSSGGASTAGLVGNASVDWAHIYSVSGLQGAGGAASVNGYSGSAGMVVLCKKKVADLLVGFPEVVTNSLNTVVTSVTQTVRGTTGTTKTISVSGAGNPEMSINGGPWVTSGSISFGQTLALRQTSAAAASTTVTATVTLGSNSFTWTVITAQPLALSFTDITVQPANALVTSAPATVTGTGSVVVNVVGTGAPEFSVNGGPWVTSGTLNGGDSVVVRLTTPSLSARKSFATFRCESCLNTTLTRWSAMTGHLVMPSLASISGAALSTQYTSSVGTIGGDIPGTYPFTTNAPTEISINGGPWVTTGSLTVGDTIQIRTMSSVRQSMSVSGGLTCLGVYGSFTITTAATTYPAFSNLVNQGKNLVVQSEVRSVSSTLVNAEVSINAASGSPQISINGGPWGTSGVLNHGDTLQARVTTSPANMTLTTVNMVIAGATTTWLVTTGNGIQLMVPNVANAIPATTVTSGSVVNTGAAGTLAVNSTAPIAEFSLDGGSTWLTSATVAAGQSVVFRASYGAAGTQTVVNVILDGVAANPWEINDGTVYGPVISAGSAVLLGAAGMTQLVSTNADDAFQTLTLPFYFSISQVQTKTWFICSNSFINVVASSTAYTGFAGNSPAVPKFFLGAADNSWQRVWYQSGANYYRIRYEGTASTSGTVGSPNIVYELTFFKAMGTRQYVQVVFGPHSRATGAFGVASSSAYYINGGTITPNSSYVFESDLKGENWVMTPNSKIIGAGTDQ